VPIEQLDVAVEVLVEVAAGDQRPADRLQGVDAERDDEQNDRTEPSVREPLERSERTDELVSLSLSQLLTAGLRRKWMSCGPSSAAGRKDASSNSRASPSCTYWGGWYALQRLVPADRS
jgi:hypothetical protein